MFKENKIEEDDICCSQISRTEAESQWIVAQRPLSHVQYLVLYLSRIQRICLSWYLNLLFSIAWPAFDCWLSVPLQCYDLEHAREHAYCYSWEHQGKQTYRRFSSMDSGLEAFSRNPTHGSFPPLAFPLSGLPIMWTNGSSRTKLDYCRGDP